MRGRPTGDRLLVGLSIVSVAVVLGGNMVALKIAIRSSDPLTVQALSTTLTAVCLLGWAAARGRPGNSAKTVDIRSGASRLH